MRRQLRLRLPAAGLDINSAIAAQPVPLFQACTHWLHQAVAERRVQEHDIHGFLAGSAALQKNHGISPQTATVTAAKGPQM